MDRLMIVLAVFSLVLIAQVMISMRREHIRVEYSVSWLAAGVALLVLSLSRGLVDRIASVLGVSERPIAILMVVSWVFLIVFYRFSIRISALKDANIALAQRVAIIEYQLKSEHERQ